MEKIYRLYKNVGDGKSKNIVDAIMHNDCYYVINYYEKGNDILFRIKKVIHTFILPQEMIILK